MPLHEYLCKKCGHRFERISKFSDPPLKKCPECGGKVEQLLSAPAVQFKGTGWYVTDYGKATKSDKPESESTSSEDKKSEKKAKESSPAKKTSEKASPPKAPSAD